MTKFGLEVLIGKALSLLLEFTDETGEKVLYFQMQIKLKSCLTISLKLNLIIFFTE